MINENPNSYNKHHNWNELENWKMNYIADYNMNFLWRIKAQNAEFTNCTHGKLIITCNIRDLIRVEIFVQNVIHCIIFI